MKKTTLLTFCTTCLILATLVSCSNTETSSSSNTSTPDSSTSTEENTPKPDDTEDTTPDENENADTETEPENTSFDPIKDYDDLNSYSSLDQFNFNMAMGLYALSLQTAQELGDDYPEDLSLTWHTEGETTALRYSIDHDKIPNTELLTSIEDFESWDATQQMVSDWAAQEDFTILFALNEKGLPSPYTTSKSWATILGIPSSPEESLSGIMAVRMSDYMTLTGLSDTQTDLTTAYELAKSISDIMDSMETPPIDAIISWQFGDTPSLSVESDHQDFNDAMSDLISSTPAPTSDIAPFQIQIKEKESGELYLISLDDQWAESLNLPLS